MSLEDKKTFGEVLDLAQRGELLQSEIDKELIEASVKGLQPVCNGCGKKSDKLFQNDLCRVCLDKVFSRLRKDVIDPFQRKMAGIHI